MTAIDESRATHEHVDTSKVPFAMRDRLHVPRERYYDRAFFELEKEKLWMRTWQMACRLEEIPEPNDFIEYEIVDQSVLLIRQPDGSVKALHNACRHRATQLERGTGNLAGGQIVCPFHGWRWNADGSPSFLFGKEGFSPECLQPQDIRLREVKVELWGGCAYINFDADAGPLLEHLSPADQLLESIGVNNWQVKWWKEGILNANWKLAQEAFMEGWHVMATHPQLTMGLGEDFPPANAQYNVYRNGHSNFQRPGEKASFPSLDILLLAGQLLADGQDAMTLDRDLYVLEELRNQLEPGDDVAARAGQALREYAEGAGIPWRKDMELNPLFFGSEVFCFPNHFYLPNYGNALSYRFRPHNDNPEQCRFEIWSLTTYPEVEQRPRVESLGRFDIDDVDNWGLIPRQDFSNIERQQRGLHSQSFEQTRLATEWEGAISNMHFELDRRLAQD